MPLQLPPLPLKIEGLRRSANADGSATVEGSVVVYYGASKLLADRITVYQRQQRATAEGRVVLIDPAGTINADRLEIGWDPARTFERADNVTVRIGNGILKARHAELDAKDWQFYDVEGTTCFRGTPVYYVTSDRVTVSPTKQATIHQPRVSVLGRFIAELPTQRASLVQAVPGIGLPGLRYKQRRGLGVTWAGGLLIGKAETFNFNASAFAKRRLTGLTQFTHSFLPTEKATQVVPPASDFNERFAHGFLNSLAVKTPETEAAYYRARRSSLSAAGQLRGSVADRFRGNHYDKLEGVYEVGGRQGAFGYLGQARLQGIRPDDGDLSPRLKLVGALSAPTVALTPKLRLLTRLDSEGFLGKTGYAWLEGTSGLTWQASPFLRLSAGAYLSGDVGTPQFGMDPLHAKRGLLARSDLQFGGFTFSYLIKQDVFVGTYDHEFAFRQVIGCFEAFYSKREFPRDRHIGLTIRVEPFVEAVKRRVAEFTGNPPPSSSTIDGKR